MQTWDVVGFDEVADLQKMPKEVNPTVKVLESGTFQRGQEAVAGDASIAMFSNKSPLIDVMVQTSRLFAPMPDIIRADMALIDRLHLYLPGYRRYQPHAHAVESFRAEQDRRVPCKFARNTGLITINHN